MKGTFEEFEQLVKSELPGAEVFDRSNHWLVIYKNIYANYFGKSKSRTLYFPKVDGEKFGSRYQNVPFSGVITAINEVDANRRIVCKNKELPLEQP